MLCKYELLSLWVGIAQLVERRTRGRTVAGLMPGRNGERTLFSRVNFLCWVLLGVRSTPVLPHRHVKDPAHSAQSAVGRLQLLKHAFATEHRSRSGLVMQSRHGFGTCQGNELASNSSGKARPQSSHLTEPLWTNPWSEKKMELVHASWCPLKREREKKKRRWGMSG